MFDLLAFFDMALDEHPKLLYNNLRRLSSIWKFINVTTPLILFLQLTIENVVMLFNHKISTEKFSSIDDELDHGQLRTPNRFQDLPMDQILIFDQRNVVYFTLKLAWLIYEKNCFWVDKYDEGIISADEINQDPNFLFLLLPTCLL